MNDPARKVCCWLSSQGKQCRKRRVAQYMISRLTVGQLVESNCWLDFKVRRVCLSFSAPTMLILKQIAQKHQFVGEKCGFFESLWIQVLADDIGDFGRI